MSLLSLFPVFLVKIGSRFWSVSYPMLLRSFCMAIFAVVPEPRNGSEYGVAFYAEHFDEAFGDFIWVGCSSSFKLACGLACSFQRPDLAEPFIALGLGEGAVVSCLVVGWEFAEVAFSE